MKGIPIGYYFLNKKIKFVLKHPVYVYGLFVNFIIHLMDRYKYIFILQTP